MTKKYTLEDRHRAAASLISCCNSIAASRECGIPASTIRGWRQHDLPFQEICQELMAEIGESMKFEYAKIIEASADELLDRIQNGDPVMDKTGELTRIPVKARDLAVAGGVTFDKMRLLEHQRTSIVAKSNDVKALAQQFAALSEQWQEK
jgi:3-keto-L-gulonate-6-phosphate decarboxylase